MESLITVGVIVLIIVLLAHVVLGKEALADNEDDDDTFNL